MAKKVDWQILAPAAAFIIIGAVLLAALPPDAFFSSDEGVKFIQIRSLAAGGFSSSALRWPGDRLGLDHRYAVLPRFFEPHGGELYSPHPILFAAAGAPGWLLFGWRGLYLLPLIAGAVAAALTGHLARVFGVRAWFAAAVVGFAGPILFYSLCLWEHTAAVALWLGGMALARRATAARLAGAGALWGLGCALRPEFYWLAVWSLAAFAIFRRGERLKAAAWPIMPLAAVAAAAELLPWAIWGQPPFERFAANIRFGSIPHPGELLFAAHHSLAPLEPWRAAAGLAAVVLLIIIAFKWRPAVFGAAAVGIVLTIIDWGFYGGFATSFTSTVPLIFAVAFAAWPEVRGAVKAAGSLEKALYLAAAGFALTLFLVVADTSGFSWGPRFLLFAIPPLALAAARALQAPFAARPWRVALVAAIAALAALSAATQLFGLQRLACEKRAHRELAWAIAALNADVVITGFWYIPLLAAPIYNDVPFAVVDDETITALKKDLAKRRIGRAYFIAELPVNPAAYDEFEDGMTSSLMMDFGVKNITRLEKDNRYGMVYTLWELEE